MVHGQTTWASEKGTKQNSLCYTKISVKLGLDLVWEYSIASSKMDLKINEMGR